MLRKLLVVISLFALSATAVFAQQTSPDGRRAQVFAYGNLFEGSYLGVETKDISRENFAQYGLKEVRGVAVEKVSENSPAQRAGLQAGDVIVRFDGAEVTSVRKLQRLISEIAPDHQATLTVFRNGSEREIKVTMGKREVPRFEGSANLFESAPPIALMPDMPRVPLPPSAPIAPLGDVEGFYSFFNSNRQMGVSVTSLTKQLGEYFGAPEGRGVLISSVRENSPADKAGLRAGDVIIEVEGKEVKGTSDLMRLINEKKDSAVNLTVIRNKSRMNVSVTPEKSK
jgi:serine protease Do